MKNKKLSERCRQVESFLSDFKNLLDVSGLPIKHRKKNEDLIFRLGLTQKNCLDILYSLSPENYYKGPAPDDLHGGNYWEFGIEIERELIYIKIKIVTDDYGNEWPVCYSFHDPEFEMSFPLRGRT